MKVRNIIAAVILIHYAMLLAACNIGTYASRDSLIQYGLWGSCPGCIAKTLEISGSGDIKYHYSSMADGIGCESHFVLQAEDIDDLILGLLHAGVANVSNKPVTKADSGMTLYIKHKGFSIKGNSLPEKVVTKLTTLMNRYGCTPK